MVVVAVTLILNYRKLTYRHGHAASSDFVSWGEGGWGVPLD